MQANCETWSAVAYRACEASIASCIVARSTSSPMGPRGMNVVVVGLQEWSRWAWEPGSGRPPPDVIGAPGISAAMTEEGRICRRCSPTKSKCCIASCCTRSKSGLPASTDGWIKRHKNSGASKRRLQLKTCLNRSVGKFIMRVFLLVRLVIEKTKTKTVRNPTLWLMCGPMVSSDLWVQPACAQLLSATCLWRVRWWSCCWARVVNRSRYMNWRLMTIYLYTLLLLQSGPGAAPAPAAWKRRGHAAKKSLHNEVRHKWGSSSSSFHRRKKNPKTFFTTREPYLIKPSVSVSFCWHLVINTYAILSIHIPAKDWQTKDASRCILTETHLCRSNQGMERER